MISKFATAMRRATGATRAFNLMGATRMIQHALAKGVLLRAAVSPVAAGETGRLKGSDTPKAPRTKALKKATTPAKARIPKKPVSRERAPARLRRPLGEVIETLTVNAPLVVSPVTRRPAFSFGLPGKLPDLVLPDGARFLTRSFASSAGSRDFRLYVPASAPDKPKGLVVMLHGCTQNPDDFALGTDMNVVAETHGLLVAYPAQTRAHNASACWNWFDPGHQIRDSGEPAILAGLTSNLVEEFGLGRDQVFVAGLSAGAAMAVIMGKTYPDVFRAVGVHSGLPYQSAGNVMSAMAVMRGKPGSSLFGKAQAVDKPVKPVRTIIFHGSADRTVHPSNAQRILDMAHAAGSTGTARTIAGSSNGRHHKRTLVADRSGRVLVESWMIDGAGHAWSGGTASGSYADPMGPDASREMVRFFLDTP
jgi:poly(hydroxyalkanoate) depolymerase family esterase